VEIIFLRHL